MQNILAGHTNSYHTYTLDEALEGHREAPASSTSSCRAVRGWTEHVPLEATPRTSRTIKAKLAHWGLNASSLSGHSDLTTAEGLVDGKKAVDLCPQLGHHLMNTAIGGHYSEDEDKAAFMGYIHELADYAAATRGVHLARGPRRHHGDRPDFDPADRGDRPAQRRHQLRHGELRLLRRGRGRAMTSGRSCPILKHIHLKDKRAARASGISPRSARATSTSGGCSRSWRRKATRRRSASRSSSAGCPGRRWKRCTAR